LFSQTGESEVKFINVVQLEKESQREKCRRCSLNREVMIPRAPQNDITAEVRCCATMSWLRDAQGRVDKPVREDRFQ
jgi:hypothetical protein